MTDTTELFLSDYLNWLKNSYKIKHLENSDQIITPFTNAINDNINIYIDKINNTEFLLSDDGETLNDLSLNGIDLTQTRIDMINRILIGSGVTLNDDELTIRGNNAQFSEKKHVLLQTILRVNDLMITRKNNIVNLFSEEVNAFLNENHVYGISRAKYAGISGLDYKIDYTIPAREEKPEVFVQFCNHLTFNEITNAAFIFEDIQAQRQLEILGENSQSKIIANDSEHKISNKAFRVAEAKNIEILPYTQKNKIITSLL